MKMNQTGLPKSCLNCPSFLDAREAVSFFRKGIGASVCARYGKPIGRVDSSVEEIANLGKAFAADCPSFGLDRPATPDWNKANFQVMLPDPKVYQETPTDPQLVNSCAGCKHFIREDVVASELGWTSALCAAKGKLLLANRLTLEARNCELRSFGSRRMDTSGLIFLPEYDDNFVGSADPIREYEKQKANFVDPTEYESDKPVSEEEAQNGIRAWRKITDPETGNEVYLPIFRLDFFSEVERAKIPRTGDDEHPEDYIDHHFFTYKTAVLWTELDETPAFWGRAGVGKTEFFRYMAWLMCLPFERFSITASTELDDLAGKMHFTEGEGTHFELGRFSKAWMKPNVVVVDEYNLGQPDVQQYLRPCIDNSKQLVLDQADGKLLNRNIDCYLGVAMNPAWDSLNVGANMIGDADANRLMHLFVELPPESLERQILAKRCERDGWEIPESSLDTIMAIAKDIRSLAEDGTLPITWAIRPQIKVARALRWFDYLTAYRMASADYLEPEAQNMLMDAVKSHVS